MKTPYTSNGYFWRREVRFDFPPGHPREGQPSFHVVLVRNAKGRLVRVEHKQCMS